MNNPYINENGNKFWYNENDELHREDGPAVEYKNGSKVWYVNNMLHRIDGPAVIWANGDIKYWINNKYYNSLEEGLMNLALE